MDPTHSSRVSRYMTDRIHPKIIMLMASTTLVTFGSLVGTYRLLF